MTPDETKDAVKAAFKEFLDEQAASFGWRVLRWIGGTALFVLVYFWMSSKGIKLL